MDIYYKILNLILDIVFVVIMSVFFYEEFLFEKEKLKVKNYFKKFKNILKPILIFIASFIIVFLILLTALFIKTYAAESDTMQASSENETLDETVSLKDEELSSISDEIENILNDSTDSDKSELSDEELESTSADGTDKPADKTIIVYQLPAQTQSALETEPETQAVIYSSIDEYVESETPVLTYSEYMIMKEIKTQNVLLLFILGLEFIIMISAWRRKR